MPDEKDHGNDYVYYYGIYRDSLQIQEFKDPQKWEWSGYWEPIILILLECDEHPDYEELGVGA